MHVQDRGQKMPKAFCPVKGCDRCAVEFILVLLFEIFFSDITCLCGIPRDRLENITNISLRQSTFRRTFQPTCFALQSQLYTG